MKPPTVVTDDSGAEVQFDGVTQCRIEWAQVREVAIEVVVRLEGDYSEAFWGLTGEGIEFGVPVELVAGSDEFNAILFALPGFDQEVYCQARKAEAEGREGRFVCWRAGNARHL